MKRSFFILLAGIIATVVIFLLRPKQHIDGNIVVVSQSATNATGPVGQNNISTKKITQVGTIVIKSSPPKIFNATKAQTIAEWTNSIPNLHSDPAIKRNWIMWQSHTNPGVPLTIGDNQDLIEFHANLINIFTRRDGSGNLRRVEMQSAWMNIEDTRVSGDALLQIMGKDETSFDAWCNKVGNNWIDQPQFSSGSVNLRDSEKVYGFQTWPTFNNEKPWCILLTITDR